jgi:hypothetical protein
LEKSPLISLINEQLKETKAAGKHVKMYWIPTHRGITGNEKADELDKHSVSHGRFSQIPIPVKDVKILRRKIQRGIPAVALGGGSNTSGCSLIMALTPGLPNEN